MSDGPSVFARYVEGCPEKESPTEPEIVRRGPQPIIPPVHPGLPPAKNY